MTKKFKKENELGHISKKYSIILLPGTFKLGSVVEI
jgi:hypothetical protein